MTLSTHEQQVLGVIEERLTWSDPKLASLLAMFTRLTSGEEMPVREKICAGWRRATRRHHTSTWRPRRSSPRSRVRHLLRRIGWRGAMLLWLVTALALTATALALSHGGGGRTCMQPWPIACAGQPLTHHPRAAAFSKPPARAA